MKTWYQSSKIDKEAGLKQNLLVAALTSLLMLPLDVVALHFAKKFNKSPEEIKQALTSEVFQEAKEVLNNTTNDPVAAELVNIAKDEVAQAKTETEKPKVDLSKWKEDINVIAKTLYGEARNQGESGMRDVASVIWTRAGKDISKLKSVALKPKQFSCWNSGDVKVNEKEPVWATCQAIAKEMFSGSFTPTVDADHYYVYKGPGKVAPAWKDDGKWVAEHGVHQFRKIYR